MSTTRLLLHCLIVSFEMVCQRVIRLAKLLASGLGTDRSQKNGTQRLTPIWVRPWMTSSIFWCLSMPVQTVRGRGDSVREARVSVMLMTTRSGLDSVMPPVTSVHKPSVRKTRSPGPRRSTRLMCRASWPSMITRFSNI